MHRAAASSVCRVFTSALCAAAVVLFGGCNTQKQPVDEGESTLSDPAAGQTVQRARDMATSSETTAGARQWYERGDAWLKRRDYPAAIDALTRAIQLDPGLADAFYQRANALADQADESRDESLRDSLTEKALADYSRAIQLDPNHADALYHRGDLFNQLRDTQRAMADFNELIRIDSLDARAYVGRAIARADLEQYAAAISDFRRAVELDPDDAKAHEALAFIQATCPLAEHRDAVQAVKNARRACELTQWDAWDYLATLAAALATAGDFDAAVNWQALVVQMATEDREADREDRLTARQLLARYRNNRPYYDQSDVERSADVPEQHVQRRADEGNTEDPVLRNARSLLQLYDTNRDGRLQAAEYKRLGPSWRELDRNGDAALSLEEVAARFSSFGDANQSRPATARVKKSSVRAAKRSKPTTRQLAQSLLQLYDQNQDGVLQREEWGHLKGRWGEADRDRDGKLSLDEMIYRMAAYTQPGAEKLDGETLLRRRFRPLPPAERLPAGLPTWFAEKDTNRDGQVMMSEFASEWPDEKLAEFKRYDRNGDGFITPRECLAGMKK